MFRKTLSSALISALLLTSFGPASGASLPFLRSEDIAVSAVIEQQAIVQNLSYFRTPETINRIFSAWIFHLTGALALAALIHASAHGALPDPAHWIAALGNVKEVLAGGAAMAILPKLPNVGHTSRKSFMLSILQQSPVDHKKLADVNPLLEQAKAVLLNIPNLPPHVQMRIRNTTLFISNQIPARAEIILDDSDPIILLHSAVARKLSRTQLLSTLGHELGHVLLTDAQWAAQRQLDEEAFLNVRRQLEDRCDLLGLFVVRQLYPVAPLDWIFKKFDIYASLKDIPTWPWGEEESWNDPHRADNDRRLWIDVQQNGPLINAVMASWDFPVNPQGEQEPRESIESPPWTSEATSFLANAFLSALAFGLSGFRRDKVPQKLTALRRGRTPAVVAVILKMIITSLIFLLIMFALAEWGGSSFTLQAAAQMSMVPLLAASKGAAPESMPTNGALPDNLSGLQLRHWSLLQEHRHHPLWKQLLNWLVDQAKFLDKEHFEDLAQETLIFLYLKDIKVEKPATLLKTYANAALHNYYFSARRQGGAKIREASDSSDVTWNSVSDRRPNEEETLLSKEQVKNLQKAIQALPKLFRDVLILDIEGLSDEKIAERLGLSIPATKSRKLRARAELHDRYVRMTSRDLDGKLTLPATRVYGNNEARTVRETLQKLGRENLPAQGQAQYDLLVPEGINAEGSAEERQRYWVQEYVAPDYELEDAMRRPVIFAVEHSLRDWFPFFQNPKKWWTNLNMRVSGAKGMKEATWKAFWSQAEEIIPAAASHALKDTFTFDKINQIAAGLASTRTQWRAAEKLKQMNLAVYREALKVAQEANKEAHRRHNFNNRKTDAWLTPPTSQPSHLTPGRFGSFFNRALFFLVLIGFLISSGSWQHPQRLGFSPEARHEFVKRYMETLRKQKAPPHLWAGENKNHSLKKLNGFQVVPDTDRRIEAIVFHGVGLSIDAIVPIIQALRNDIRIVILTPFEEADLFQVWTRVQKIPGIEKRVTFVHMTSVGTSWARDPYLVLFNSKTDQYTLLPARGDGGTGQNRGAGTDLMRFDLGVHGFVPNTFRDPTLDLEGGDVTADDHYAYVGEASIHDSRYTSASELKLSHDESVEKIQQVTGKQVIDLGDADFHNDRYHIPVGATAYGPHTSLVGDIGLALKLLGASKKVIRDAARSPETLALAKVVEQLTRQGIAVRRVPMLPKDFYGNKDGRYYTNVIMDWYTSAEGKPVKQVIVPHYGIPAMDEAADQVYRDLGFVVTPVDGRLLGQGEGGPRCAVQVFAKPIAAALKEKAYDTRSKNNAPSKPETPFKYFVLTLRQHILAFLALHSQEIFVPARKALNAAA